MGLGLSDSRSERPYSLWPAFTISLLKQATRLCQPEEKSNSLEWSSRINSPVCSEVSHTELREEWETCLVGLDEEVCTESFRWVWSETLTTCRCDEWSEIDTTWRCGWLSEMNTTWRCGGESVATTTWRLEPLTIACCAALSLLRNCRDCLLFLCFGIRNANLESWSVALSLFANTSQGCCDCTETRWWTETRDRIPILVTAPNVGKCEHRITNTLWNHKHYSKIDEG